MSTVLLSNTVSHKFSRVNSSSWYSAADVKRVRSLSCQSWFVNAAKFETEPGGVTTLFSSYGLFRYDDFFIKASCLFFFVSFLFSLMTSLFFFVNDNCRYRQLVKRCNRERHGNRCFTIEQHTSTVVHQWGGAIMNSCWRWLTSPAIFSHCIVMPLKATDGRFSLRTSFAFSRLFYVVVRDPTKLTPWENSAYALLGKSALSQRTVCNQFVEWIISHVRECVCGCACVIIIMVSFEPSNACKGIVFAQTSTLAIFLRFDRRTTNLELSNPALHCKWPWHL